MNERWRPLGRYPYEVSDQGRVRRTVSRTCGKAGALLKQCRRSVRCPYAYVELWHDGIGRKFFVHRLVAEAFVPGDTQLQVNHDDGNKANNCATNLEWATRKQQMQHAHASGLMHPPSGRRHWQYRATPAVIRRIKKLRKSGLSQRVIGNIVGLSQQHVSALLSPG